MRKEIDVACPDYLGAPYPPFDEMAINESKFEHNQRYKECYAYIEDGHGYVEWLSQLDENPSEAWENEVKRAFIANGLKTGDEIKVKFGSRDIGYIHFYTIKL